MYASFIYGRTCHINKELCGICCLICLFKVLGFQLVIIMLSLVLMKPREILLHLLVWNLQ